MGKSTYAKDVLTCLNQKIKAEYEFANHNLMVVAGAEDGEADE